MPHTDALPKWCFSAFKSQEVQFRCSRQLSKRQKSLRPSHSYAKWFGSILHHKMVPIFTRPLIWVHNSERQELILYQIWASTPRTSCSHGPSVSPLSLSCELPGCLFPGERILRLSQLNGIHSQTPGLILRLALSCHAINLPHKHEQTSQNNQAVNDSHSHLLNGNCH